MPVIGRYFLGLREGRLRKPSDSLLKRTLASRIPSKYLEF